MFSADLSSIANAATTLGSKTAVGSALFLATPTLAGYSSIPSLQSVAMQHSNAINGATGSSTLVASALLRELEWASFNLRSLENVVRRNESSLRTLFNQVDPLNSSGNLATSFSEISGSFNRRPPFQVGNFVFTPAAVTSEAATDIQSLLSMFSATNDGLVASATAYWNSYAAQMTALSDEIASVSANLSAANKGLVFEAANATLAGFSARASQIATSAEILSGHLQVLPAVKAMAINALSSIQQQSSTIRDTAAKKAFEQAEVAAFMSGPYATELQGAVPGIPNLVSPDVGGGISSIAMSGANVAGIGGTSQAGLAPTGMSGVTSPASAAVTTAATIPEHLTQMASAHSPASAPFQSSATTPAGPNPMEATNPAAALAQPSGSAQPGGLGNSFKPMTSANGATPPSPMMSATMPGARSATSAQKAPAPMTTPGNGIGTAGNIVRGIGAGGNGIPASNSVLGAGRHTGNGGSHAGSNRVPGASGVAGRFAGGANSGAGSARSGSGAASRSEGLRNVLLGRGTQVVGATGSNSGSNAHGVLGAGRGFAQQATNVSAIRRNHNDASQFEQNEYQLELFGEEPTTVPAVIGSNVRG